MNIDWNAVAAGIRKRGDEKLEYLTDVVTRISHISTGKVQELTAALADAPGPSFVSVGQPLLDRFRLCAQIRVVFEERLEKFNAGVASGSAMRMKIATSEMNAHAQNSVVLKRRADALKLLSDEFLSLVERAVKAHADLQPALHRFSREHALSLVFNLSEVAAALNPDTSHLAHFVAPALDTARMLAERYGGKTPNTPLWTTASALSNLDALADTVDEVMLWVFRLPEILPLDPRQPLLSSVGTATEAFESFRRQTFPAR